MNTKLIKIITIITIIAITTIIIIHNFKPHSSKIIADPNKWNYMIDLWVDNKLDNPIQHLITYDSEVNNGGHLQFFENCHEELPEIIPLIKTYLSKNMAKNLQDAYDLYLNLNPNTYSIDTFVDVAREDHFDKFDNYYYEHDKEVNQVLTKYSLTLKIK